MEWARSAPTTLPQPSAEDPIRPATPLKWDNTIPHKRGVLAPHQAS